MKVRIVAALLWLASPRVDGKGCFLRTSQVTMHDGTRKQLGDIEKGDQVLSWDDVEQRQTLSTVQVIPSFPRAVEDLVEVVLPHAQLYATKDHPFWSSSHSSIVSVHPEGTAEEYGLTAMPMVAGVELQLEDMDPVKIAAIRPATASNTTAVLMEIGRSAGVAQRVLRGSSVEAEDNELHDVDDVEVMTLCLDPHHWFYVEGVRVHNKGCFLGDATVSMADGTKKALDDISVGDEVVSFDEEARATIASTVRAVPTFTRPRSELMHLQLPSSMLVATQDHPLWSAAQQSLVSAKPDQTREEYDLDVQQLQEVETFEDESQAPVNASVVIQQSQRALRGEEESVVVKTLCLEPHHWFYVQGVRVHNKGCFAPWTPVLMSNFEEKPIAQIQPSEKVLSWDSETQQLTEATVLSRKTYDVEQPMLQVLINSSSLGEMSGRRMEQHFLAANGPPLRRMVVTADHPLYSHRVGDLVSMSPDVTFANYNLSVQQMAQNGELLHHHSGEQCPASVTILPSADHPAQVMTLHLQEHHWFFAHGVRVHNKGGGGGGGRSGGGGSGGGGGGWGGTRTVTRTHTAASLGTVGFAHFVIFNGGSRRRYGTYIDEGGACDIRESADVTSSCRANMYAWDEIPDCPWEDFEDQSTRPACTLAPSLLREDCGEWCCHDCVACADEACIARLPNCADFLGDAFENCQETEEEQEGWGALIVVVIVAVIFCVVCAFCFCTSRSGQNGRLREMAEKRTAVQGGNAKGLTSLSLSGTYTENGETRPTFYQLTFTSAGEVNGRSEDDDGPAVVKGTLSWLGSTDTRAEMYLNEKRKGVEMEIQGELRLDGCYIYDAHYFSSYESTTGILRVSSTKSADGYAAPVVMGQVVHDLPLPPQVPDLQVEELTGSNKQDVPLKP